MLANTAHHAICRFPSAKPSTDFSPRLIQSPMPMTSAKYATTTTASRTRAALMGTKRTAGRPSHARRFDHRGGDDLLQHLGIPPARVVFLPALGRESVGSDFAVAAFLLEVIERLRREREDVLHPALRGELLGERHHLPAKAL